MRSVFPDWSKSALAALGVTITLWGWIYSQFETQRLQYAEQAAIAEARSIERLYQQYLSLAEEAESDDASAWAIEKVRAATDLARFELYTVPKEGFSTGTLFPKFEFRTSKFELDYLGQWKGKNTYVYRIFVRPEFVGAFHTSSLASLRKKFGLYGFVTFLVLWGMGLFVLYRRKAITPVRSPQDVPRIDPLAIAHKFHDLVLITKEVLDVTSEIRSKVIQILRGTPLSDQAKAELESLIAASQQANALGQQLASGSKEAVREIAQKTQKAS